MNMISCHQQRCQLISIDSLTSQLISIDFPFFNFLSCSFTFSSFPNDSNINDEKSVFVVDDDYNDDDVQKMNTAWKFVCK